VKRAIIRVAKRHPLWAKPGGQDVISDTLMKRLRVCTGDIAPSQVLLLHSP
jgi:hypothetical protein